MENIYLFIVVLLFILAISDLIVGVSNDAVNFLNSAIGSKVAPLRIILIVAALGILAGATFSNGMMEVARKGIFVPQNFSFADVMIIFLAVMMTDVILLDLFNTFGLPTSTTVSIVFELLGAAVAMAILRIIHSDTENITDIAKYINSAKALGIISGILVSVVVAFSTGALVQYLSRLLFTFRYNNSIRYLGSIWGGLAIAAITYFILIKGAKGASFMTEETIQWIKGHTWHILAASFLGWTIILQVCYWIFKLNSLKLVVLVGTFALAMAFAGNDLVNFIGVPLAGFQSFQNHLADGAPIANEYMMDALQDKVKTPTLYLLIAGLIMVITLWLSKKAKSVVRTSISLSDQSETNERFESSMLARTLVRQSIMVSDGIKRILPDSFIKKVGDRFDPTYFNEVVRKEEGVSFDLLRASVNLIVAAILIAIGTALKLPLSTTYVTFMVAMGSSLADGAWDRESAVYRITGVITVVGGWFFTAFSAFTISLVVAFIIAKTFPFGILALSILVLFLVYRTHILHRNREKEDSKADLQVTSKLSYDSDSIYEICSNNIVRMLLAASKSFDEMVTSLTKEERKKLQQNLKAVRKLDTEAKELKRNIPGTIKKLNEESMESSHYYIELIDYIRELMHSLCFTVEPAYKHVDNNHKPLSEFQSNSLKELAKGIHAHVDTILKDISKSNFDHAQKRIEDALQLVDRTRLMRKKQLKIMKRDGGSTRTNLLFLDALNETKNLILNINNVYKSFRSFSEQIHAIEIKKVF